MVYTISFILILLQIAHLYWTLVSRPPPPALCTLCIYKNLNITRADICLQGQPWFKSLPPRLTPESQLFRNTFTLYLALISFLTFSVFPWKDFVVSFATTFSCWWKTCWGAWKRLVLWQCRGCAELTRKEHPYVCKCSRLQCS